MGIAEDAIRTVGKALDGVRAGADKLASRKASSGTKARKWAGKGGEIAVTSAAFTHGGALPVSATADGAGVPPPIEFSNLPADTKSVVVMVEDPDAPFPEPFVHWLAVRQTATSGTLDAHSVAAGDWHEGKNTKLAQGFTPAAPPPGHGAHHYHFQVFALDAPIELKEAFGRGALLEQIEEHGIAWGELVGTYERT